MYLVHKDFRGTFQELIKVDDVRFGQLSILTIEPMQRRGNHYHQYTTEWFCCIHGKCELLIHALSTGSDTVLKLDGNQREFVEIRPLSNHILVNHSSLELCEVLIIADRVFDPNNPDVFNMGT